MSKLNAALVAVVAALSMFFYCYYFSQADKAKEQIRTIAVTEATEPEKVEETTKYDEDKELWDEFDKRLEEIKKNRDYEEYYFYDYANDPDYVYDEYFDDYFFKDDSIWVYDLDSSVIMDTGYNYHLESLQIVFRTSPDTEYEYYDVPVEVWHGLLGADSPGKYFNRYIKGQYDFDKYKDDIDW